MNKIFILLLCALCLWVYSNTLRNNFVLDDQYLIVDNPVIKSFKYLKSIFFFGAYSRPPAAKETMPIDTMYRPMQLLSYSLDYRIWKLNYTGYHLMNIVLHALNCVLVYFFCRFVLVDSMAKVISVLFCVHPINTSVVSYISGRADLLAAFFILLSTIVFYKFMQGMRLRYYALSLVCASLALLCRENALILFLFITLATMFNAKKRISLAWVLPFLLLDLLYILWRFAIFNAGTYASAYSLPITLRITNFLNIAAHYIYLVIFPVNLHMFRSLDFLYNPLNPNVIFAVLVIALSVFAVDRRRRLQPVSFGILWFLIGLIPVFFIFDSYKWLGRAMMAESWAYLSSIGILLVLAFALHKLQAAGKILFIIAAVSYAGLTIISNEFWANNIVVYENIMKYLPERNPVRIKLIKEYMKGGFVEDANREIKKFYNAYPGIGIPILRQELKNAE